MRCGRERCGTCGNSQKMTAWMRARRWPYRLPPVIATKSCAKLRCRSLAKNGFHSFPHVSARGASKRKFASKIRRLRFRNREQVLAEMIPVVLRADRLQSRIGRLAPALDHMEGLIEGVRVLDRHACLQHVAVGGDLVALDHMLFLGVRRAEIVDEAEAGGKADGVDDQFAVSIAADGFPEP